MGKQETASSGDMPNGKASPGNNIAGDVSRSDGTQNATGDSLNSTDTPEYGTGENLPRGDGQQEAATIDLTDQASPEYGTGEDVPRGNGQQGTTSDRDNRTNQVSPESGVADGSSTSPGEQGAIGSAGDNPANQGSSVVNVEVDDPQAGDPNGQAALVLAAASLPSIRRPSSTLVWLMVVQVQFLAVLSLVDSVGSENSWLSNFLESLR